MIIWYQCNTDLSPSQVLHEPALRMISRAFLCLTVNSFQGKIALCEATLDAPCENTEAREIKRWAASSSGAWFAGRAAPAAAALALGPWSMWRWPWAAAARRGLLHNVGHAVQRAPADPLVQRLARRAFHHLWLNYRDLLLAPRLDAAALGERVEIEGEAVLQRLRRRGQGAILLGGHFAGGELALQALALPDTGNPPAEPPAPASPETVDP